MTSSELVTEYYSAFNSSNFNRLNAIIADSITIEEGGYVMSYTKESFHEQFKWDSIFQPTYRIVELEELNSHIIATVEPSSKRCKFLKNDPLTCRFRIFFNSNEITKLELLDCLNADWKIWQSERDSLVNWTGRNHPVLDGFIHDQSMNGAINYLNAIELYEERKNSPTQSNIP